MGLEDELEVGTDPDAEVGLLTWLEDEGRELGLPS
jgi:hypothetical protein